MITKQALIIVLTIFSFTVWAFTADPVETPATHLSLGKANLPQIIPAENFYTVAVKSWAHQISPNGDKLAWVEWVDGKPTLHVRLLDRGETTRTEHPVFATRLLWAFDNRHLVFRSLLGSQGLRRLFVVDTRNLGESRDILPFDQVIVQSTLALLGKPGTISVQMNLRNRHHFDLYEVNLETGVRRLIETNDGNGWRWIVSRTGRVMGRFRYVEDGGWTIEGASPLGNWKTVLSGKVTDELRLAHNLRDNDTSVYILTSVGRDTASLIKLNLGNGEQEVVFEYPNIDISNFAIDYFSYEPLHVTYHDALPDSHFFDPEVRNDFHRLLGPGPLALELSSSSLDRTRFTVRATTDRTPPSTYLIDRRTGGMETLVTHPLKKYTDVFSETRPIRFRARDGLSISGYLTLPRGADGKNLPTVLKVHGGPWTRDVWGFDIDTQFLANRGYAVLEVNFRGSKGFGKAFLELGRNEFGGKMQDDVIDAVDWIIAQGYADPEKIAIFGYSYGGYSALVGVTRTPRKFAAGVSAMGYSDLARQVASRSKTFRGGSEWRRLVGNPDDPEGYRDLMERSPINYIEQIQRPLLIVHGAKDPRVSVEHSDRLVAKLREKGIGVEYLLFPDEGHEIVKPKNRLKFARRLEKFLATHLGGRAIVPE